jgi:MFS family permease
LSPPYASRQYLRHLRTLSRNAKLYLAATVFQGLGSGVWGVLFYLYLKLPRVGFKDDFIGNMFTASAIATGLVALPAGLLCERIGPKRAILIGVLANLVNIAQITVLQPAGLLIASLVSGLIGTVSWVAAAPLLMENSRPEERTYLFSFQSTLSIIMSVVGSFIGGVMPDLFNGALGLPTGLASSVVGYRISLAMAIAFSLSVGFPVLLMRRSANSDAHRMIDLLALKNIRSSRTIIKFMIPTAIIGLGAGFVVPLVNPFFLDRYKATSVEIGIISALGNVTLGIATLVTPLVSNRLSKVKSVALCQFLSMPFIMLTSLSPSLTWAASSYIARTALMNMAGPVGTTFQMELVTPAERATTNGLMVMSDNIPRAATATVSGILLTKGDYFTPFLYMTIAYFVAASSYFAFFRNAEGRKASCSSFCGS